VVLVDVVERKVVGTREFADVSGIAAGAQRGELLATSGSGRAEIVGIGEAPARQSQFPWAWDNHAVRVP